MEIAVYLESRQELLLPRDVRCEDERADVTLEFGPNFSGQLIVHSALEETRDCRSPMMVLEDRSILRHGRINKSHSSLRSKKDEYETSFYNRTVSIELLAS